MKTVSERLRALYVIVGLLAALVTGLIPVSPLAGGIDYRLPIPWLVKLVLSPELFSWRVKWVNLIIDVAIWTAICFIIQDISENFKRHLASTGSG